MKKYLLLISLLSFLISDYQLNMLFDNVDGIRLGMKVKYEGQDAGKVKKITPNEDGGFTVVLNIYKEKSSQFSSNKSEIPTLTEDMLFKVDGRSLVVDLNGMEKRKIRKEEKKLAKIKAEKDAKAAKIAKIEAQKAKAEEDARIAVEKAKAEEDARIAAEKAKAEKVAKDKARRLKAAADNSPFAGDIEKIKAFQNANGLDADGFWGSGSQKVYDNIKAKEVAAKASSDAKMKAEKAKAKKDARMAAAKAKEDARMALEKAKAEEDARIAAEKAKLKEVAKELKASENQVSSKSDKASSRNELDLLREQYDNPPKLKKKLKIKAKKYKGKDPVTVKFFINKKGKTEEVMLKNSSGNSSFDSDVISAIKKSKWKPAIKDGKKVGAWHQLEVSF
tara:strand:+ start:406 stop:1581 length:1176 start_codon:yes stop_codon:yes gene_type:complete